LSLILCLAAGSAWGADLVERIDDTSVSGTVVSINSRESVLVQAAEGETVRTESVPASEVLLIRFAPGETSESFQADDRLTLSSGERWLIRTLPSDKSNFVCGSGAALKGKNSVPFADLRAFLPVPWNTTETLREVSDFEKELLVLAGEQDVIVTSNGDRMTGVVESVGADEVAAASKLGRVTLKRDRISGLAFSKTLKPYRAPAGQVAAVSLIDGSLVIGEIAGPEGDVYRLKSVLGPTWDVHKSMLREVRFRGGKLVWLSDLDPADVKYTPFFNRTWEFRRDRSVLGNPLKCGDRTYERGIGAAARTEISWELGGEYALFIAEVGIDAETGKAGSAFFSVLGDGKELLARTEAAAGAAPKPVKLDLGGIRRLTLIVDFGRDAGFADHGDWLNARLIRK
jgi:hypothetical protein